MLSNMNTSSSHIVKPVSNSGRPLPRWREVSQEKQETHYGIHKPLTQEQLDMRALRQVRARMAQIQ